MNAEMQSAELWPGRRESIRAALAAEQATAREAVLCRRGIASRQLKENRNKAAQATAFNSYGWRKPE
jgi:hypothetical protein